MAALRRILVMLWATGATAASIASIASEDTSTSTLTSSTSTSSTQTTSTTTSSTTMSTTSTATSSTSTSSTQTTSTTTTSTSTTTISTTSTTTSTTGPHVWGGERTQEAFRGWRSVWRSKYRQGLWRAKVSDPWDSALPECLRGVELLVVESEGGVAQGVVSEGMGYGIMFEGLQAARGSKKALKLGLSLVKSWLGLVAGPGGKHPTPLAAGADFDGSATEVDSWPYGISAVNWSHSAGTASSGLPTWKFPIELCSVHGSKEGNCMGSATDGDQDAILGMIYLAAAMGYPEDFVDMVMRTVISFASADLGFPDLYRTLPDGTQVFVPKLGSMWGGLLPEGGKFKTKQQPWCYGPGYFAPAHYRVFRDFVAKHWQPGYDDYLPMRQNGQRSQQPELLETFESAIVAGYNILYYSSCKSGSVSNWVGVKTPCADNDTLSCAGVPWAHTPYVGADGGRCEQSGTKFGSYGADASRLAWRIALDYVLFREESAVVRMFDRDGRQDLSIRFGAKDYLNRIVVQYKTRANCDGGIAPNAWTWRVAPNGSHVGVPGCMNSTNSPYQLAYAFDVEKYGAPDIICSNVPNKPESWWAGYMAYPTFAAFVAPHDGIPADQMSHWMDTFSSICNFSQVNVVDYGSGGKPFGKICMDTYFEASQAVISTMIMSGSLFRLPATKQVFVKAEDHPSLRGGLGLLVPMSSWSFMIMCVGGVTAAWMMRKARAQPGHGGRPLKDMTPRGSASSYRELRIDVDRTEDPQSPPEVRNLRNWPSPR